MDSPDKNSYGESFLKTSVSPKGKFVWGCHKPAFSIANLRERDSIIGNLSDSTPISNKDNFPEQDIEEKQADVIYEIPNPFPFRGTTYINSAWADKNSEHPEAIRIPEQEPFSFQTSIKKWLGQNNFFKDQAAGLLKILPRPLIIAIAESSTDPEELVILAETVCVFVCDENNIPTGLRFKRLNDGKTIPDIQDHDLFEIIANNQFLPDAHKNAMVLAPGIQGISEITGDIHQDDSQSHVYEYLRKNSYIPWGHFAANMANNSIRYNASKLLPSDMEGMRHLYYQRTYLRLAEQLDISFSGSELKKSLSPESLEELRCKILSALSKNSKSLQFNRSLWGWNYGFGYSHSGYNLHASHQQIHQQFAMIPKQIPGSDQMPISSYACGDLVETFVQQYRKETRKSFFKNYLDAVDLNTRTDGDLSKESSLKVFEDDNVVLFVPKAQTSQFELQLMPKKQCGNILEADLKMRRSIDKAILKSIQTLEFLGVKMVTSIEFSKRFDLDNRHDQQLLYSFLPKIPKSPGAFSEAQLRWINGHFPEDFAQACRSVNKKML